MSAFFSEFSVLNWIAIALSAAAIGASVRATLITRRSLRRMRGRGKP